MKTKLISQKTVCGNEISIYRHEIMAGMEFCYTKGKTKNNKIKAVGYYDFEIITNNIGETISERKLQTVFYNR